MTEGMYTNSRNPPLCGESVTVGCRSGYKLKGASTVVCLQGGTFIWLGAAANCVKGTSGVACFVYSKLTNTDLKPIIVIN